MAQKNSSNPKKYHPNTRLINSMLVLMGIRHADLAKSIGITRQYLTYVIHGQRKGERIRKKIAELLGMPYATLWFDKEDK